MTHKTLTAALKAGVPAGERIYKATVSGETVYVVSYSPKSAAEAIVQPSLVPQKDVLAAAMELVAGKGEA